MRREGLLAILPCEEEVFQGMELKLESTAKTEADTPNADDIARLPTSSYV